jgi:hypothetical protein
MDILLTGRLNGREVAMLMLIWAAAAAAEVPQQTAAPLCRTGTILVSKAIERERHRQEPGQFPRDKADAKGPAVLMPACKPEHQKKNDHPMA